MKAIIRIPTVQFGYIELELDNIADDPVNTPKLIQIHNDMVAEYEKTKAGVQKLKDDRF